MNRTPCPRDPPFPRRREPAGGERAVAAALSAFAVLSAAAPAPAPAAPAPGGGYGNKGTKEEKKPEPTVIRLQSAQKGRHNGQDAMIVTGVEVVSGRPRSFAVENEPPQDKFKPPKYEPKARAKEGIDKVKPGEYLKVEPKSARDQVPWIDKAEPYIPKPHEEDPGTFVLFDAYKEDKGGTEVFRITLMKFGAYVDCYAQMVKDGKKSVPDPAVVKAAEEIMDRTGGDAKKKELVEATVAQKGGAAFVTALSAFQPPKSGKFGKVVEADVGGNKGQAVELEHEGQTLTLAIPGKMSGTRWVTDANLLADAKRLKPGAAVVFKTREDGDSCYVRHLAPAPKESAKKEAADGPTGPMLGSKERAKK